MGTTQAIRTIRQAKSGELMGLLSVHGRQGSGGLVPLTSSEIERQTWSE